jgi:hypothetical protein
MPPTKTCRYCQKKMPTGSLFVHETVCHDRCPQRPLAGDAQESPAPQAGTAKSSPKPRVAIHARKPAKRATAKAGLLEYCQKMRGKLTDQERGERAPKVWTSTHCEAAACPYRGLSAHIARLRVQELVRGGLGLEDAARFVREQCG